VTNFSGEVSLGAAQDGTGASEDWSEVASTLCLSALAHILSRLVTALLVIQTLLRNVTRSVTLYFRACTFTARVTRHLRRSSHST
jgi:hypothetical protein